MLENIKEIGIFMIIAQAVVHFAPGRQYEKYIKLISSVIILLLFMGPFVQAAGVKWQDHDILDGMRETAEMPLLSADSVNVPEDGVEDAVVKRMEEEIADRLNQELTGEKCFVKQVRLMLMEGTEPFEKEALFSVEVLIGERGMDESRIAVEEITIGTGRERDNEVLEAFRERIAAFLELEEERVEVRWDG